MGRLEGSLGENIEILSMSMIYLGLSLITRIVVLCIKAEEKEVIKEGRIL